MRSSHLLRLICLTPMVLLVPHLGAAPEDDIRNKLSKDAQQDLNLFKVPTSSLEAWKIVEFEVGVGKYEVAAEFLKLIFEFNPTEKEFLDLERRYTIQPFLQLRNIQRWSRNEQTDKEARENVEKLISSIEAALQQELSNPERIRKFINRLTGETEEVAWAIKELRRSGAAAIPIIVDVLQAKPSDELRAAIYEYLPKLDPVTVPPLLAYLDVPDPDTRANLLMVLLRRNDFVALSQKLQTDVTPSLWHLYAPLPGNDATRPIATTMLRAIIGGDPSKRTPAKELIQYAEKVYRHQANFSQAENVVIWKWDGKGIVSQTVPVSLAEEHYGLRFARWALESEPASLDAQNVFLSLALEKHFLRAGLDQPLAKSSPVLYASLSTASPELLESLLSRALRDEKPAIATGVLEVIADRGDKGLAANGPSKPNGQPRYGVVIDALNSSDRRVQFAAAEALLRLPGEANHPFGARVVEVLREAIREDKPVSEVPSKPRILLAKSDRTKSEMVARLIRTGGFDVDLVMTGKDVFRKLNETAEYDLILLDSRLPYPPLPEILAQLRADARVGKLPLLLIAVPDRHEENRLLEAIAQVSDSKYTTTGMLEAAAIQLKNFQEQLTLLREREVEKLSRLARLHQGVRVIPEYYTELPWQKTLTSALVDPINPARSDVEKKAAARLAAEWLRKIAVGEVKGYQIDPQTQVAVRRILDSDELAPFAIDAVGQFNTKDAQSDLANLVLSTTRPAPLRIQAVEVLVGHLQVHGKAGLSDAQIRAISEAVVTEANPEVKSKFLVLKGILDANPKATGELLKGYEPSLPAPAPKEPKKVDEKKDDEK